MISFHLAPLNFKKKKKKKKKTNTLKILFRIFKTQQIVFSTFSAQNYKAPSYFLNFCTFCLKREEKEVVLMGKEGWVRERNQGEWGGRVGRESGEGQWKGEWMRGLFYITQSFQNQGLTNE